jgi:hypothetical protein
MPSSATLKAIDYSGEATRFGFNMLQVTAANFDAQVVLLDNIQTAVGNVALGTFLGKSMQAVNVAVGPKATVVNAQREAKWRVTYTDDVQPEGNGSFEIGMPDLSLLVAGTGKMDVSAGAGAALVTAIEAGVVSRLGNAVTVDDIIHVGRNV